MRNKFWPAKKPSLSTYRDSGWKAYGPRYSWDQLRKLEIDRRTALTHEDTERGRAIKVEFDRKRAVERLKRLHQIHKSLVEKENS